MTGVRVVEIGGERAAILQRLELIDENPDVLASGLPAFLEAELPRLNALAPKALASELRVRRKVLTQERVLRQADAKRTVDSPMGEVAK